MENTNESPERRLGERRSRERRVRREKRARKIKKVIRGVAGFLQKEKRIINKDEIKSILPHRGRMLLLDRVVITENEIVGEFLVTEEVCKGHQFKGQLIFRGVDIIEMSAQLLGVWAAQHPEFKGKLAYFKNLKGGVKFSNKIVPSDLLMVEIPVKKEKASDDEEEENLRIEIIGRPGRLIQKVIGENFTARVNKIPKATISCIELIVIDN